MQRTGHVPYTNDLRANHTALVSELQQALRRLDQLEINPRIAGDLDMQGGRIKNLGSSATAGDATSRKELIDNGLYVNAQGQHIAHSDVVVRGNIRSRAQAREPFDLVPYGQLTDILAKFFEPMVLGVRNLALENGTNNDVVLNQKTVALVTGPTAPFAISGFLDGNTNRTGRVLILVNGTGFPMTILDRLNGLSALTNRIATNKDVDMETQTDGVVVFCYLASVWRVLAAIL